MGDMEARDISRLIFEYQDGKESAFEEIYENFYAPLYRFVLGRVNSKHEAEDLTQNIFIKFYQALSNGSDILSPKSYLFMIGKNIIIDYYRSKDQKPIVSDEIIDLISDEKQDPENTMEKMENTELVWQAIKKLNEVDQEIIILSYINELSNEELAEFLGKSDTATRQAKSRALKSFREKINELNI